jgi:hypothetical protein
MDRQALQAPAPLMQREFAHHVAPLARRDQLAMGKTHRMKRTFKFALPEFDKAKELTIQHVAIIGHPIEKFRRGQPVSLEHHFRLRHLHVSLLSLPDRIMLPEINYFSIKTVC